MINMKTTMFVNHSQTIGEFVHCIGYLNFLSSKEETTFDFLSGAGSPIFDVFIRSDANRFFPPINLIKKYDGVKRDEAYFFGITSYLRFMNVAARKKFFLNWKRVPLQNHAMLSALSVIFGIGYRNPTGDISLSECFNRFFFPDGDLNKFYLMKTSDLAKNTQKDLALLSIIRPDVKGEYRNLDKDQLVTILEHYNEKNMEVDFIYSESMDVSGYEKKYRNINFRCDYSYLKMAEVAARAGSCVCIDSGLMHYLSMFSQNMLVVYSETREHPDVMKAYKPAFPVLNKYTTIKMESNDLLEYEYKNFRRVLVKKSIGTESLIGLTKNKE